MPLQVPTASTTVQRRLTALGYDSIEQLAGAAEAARVDLETYLGIDVKSLIDSLPAAPMTVPFEAMQAIQNADYTLGVAIGDIPRAEAAYDIPFVDAAAVATCANHVAQMPSIRNQQSRGTCVAHAALAAGS